MQYLSLLVYAAKHTDEEEDENDQAVEIFGVPENKADIAIWETNSFPKPLLLLRQHSGFSNLNMLYSILTYYVAYQSQTHQQKGH